MTSRFESAVALGILPGLVNVAGKHSRPEQSVDEQSVSSQEPEQLNARGLWGKAIRLSDSSAEAAGGSGRMCGPAG